ncbi:MAG: hypothetical protein K6E98_03060 [Lachnospiraceae bacterium]|nr:hypothetical protein [Lachnospiraceae bacterium]
MKTKKVPLIVMLLAGAVTCIVTYLDHYNLHDMLVVLLIVLIIFLIIGLIIKKIFDFFGISTDDAVDDEGEVVEKLNVEDGEDDTEGDENGLNAENGGQEADIPQESEG